MTDKIKQAFSIFVILSLLTLIIFAGVSSVNAVKRHGTGLISLNIDDGHNDTLLNAFPILQADNITATSYVISAGVGELGYMNLSQVKELQKDGWEIGSHSCTHPHMTQNSSDQAWHQLNDSKNWFTARGINVTTFAFPYGDENTNLTHMASKLYHLTRGTTNDYISYRTIPSNRSVMGVALPLNDDQTFRFIDKAIRDRAWIIFYFHQVDSSGHVVGGGQDLRAIADYIHHRVQEGELKVVTMQGAIDKLGLRK